MTQTARIFDFAAAKTMRDHRASAMLCDEAFFDQRPYAVKAGISEGRDGFWILTYPETTQAYTIPSSLPEQASFLSRDVFLAHFTDEFFSRHLTPRGAAQARASHFSDMGCDVADTSALPIIYGLKIKRVDNIVSDGFYARAQSKPVPVKRGQLVVCYNNAALEVMGERMAADRLHYWDRREENFARWPKVLPY